MQNILSKRARFTANPIAEVHRAAEALSKNGMKILRMDTGDPAVYFKTPKYILDAYHAALNEGKTYYGRAEGVLELVNAVIDRYKRMYNLNIQERDVVVTAGLSEAFFFLNNALIDQGDSAILLKPYYPPYHMYLKIHSGNELFGKYDEKNKWNVDVDSIKKLFGKKHGRIKYIIITNPNNPTGTVLKRNTLKEIIDIANEHKVFLISDEIYDEIVYNNAAFTSLSKLAKGMPHMIWNGASKNLDATGFRVGFAIIPEQDKTSRAIKETFSNYAVSRLSINTPAQYAIAEAMNNVLKHNVEIKSMVKEIAARANYATDLINKSEYFETVRPNGAFYLFPRIKMEKLRFKNDDDFVLSALKETGVQVRSGSAFGEPGHFRLVALAPKDILSSAIGKLDGFCERHKK